MLVIGVVGGIASGKSVVARRLAAWGAELLDADRAGHDVLEQPDVRAALRARWGAGVFSSSGQVNRAAVAAVVFDEQDVRHAELRFLEGLTHPRIRARLEGCIAQLRQNGQTPAVVLDAPLLFEAHWDTLCDRILFVDAPEPLRRERAERTRGWTADEFHRREAAQLDLAVKRARADTIIDNSGTPAATWQQVDYWWQTEMGPSAGHRPNASPTASGEPLAAD